MTQHIHAPEAQQVLASGTAVLLDVRDGDEWRAARIPGAVHVPLHELPDRLAELPQDKLVVCQCASGGRSLGATAFLARQGFKAANLVGGIMDWHRRGLPVES